MQMTTLYGQLDIGCLWNAYRTASVHFNLQIVRKTRVITYLDRYISLRVFRAPRVQPGNPTINTSSDRSDADSTDRGRTVLEIA